MARTAKNTETDTEATPATDETATPKKREAVKLVLQGAHQIAAEVAGDDDALPARRGRTSALDDELQTVFDGHVALSWEKGRMLALQVPAEAEREVIKRLRHAAQKAGLGLSVGNVRPDPTNPANVRVPFQAKVRKQYKPRAGKISAE
jgi:uncharacterized membrane protein